MPSQTISPYLVPMVIFVWIGFLGCLGFFLSARMMQVAFQRRMQQTLQITDEDLDDIARQQHAEEMSQSLAQRLLAPLLKRLGAFTKAKAKGAAGEQIREMLEQAGHPLGMYYAEFVGLKIFSLVFCLGLGIASSLFAVPLILNFMGAGNDPSMGLMATVMWVAVFLIIGMIGPTMWLRRYVNGRVRQIRKAMADVVDLIVLAIEAGLGFDQAVGEAVAKTNGPLTEELRRVLDEVRVGKIQSEAFRDMALRVRMPELSLLVAAIDQAMKMGVGLAAALRLQAIEIRERRMAFIREQAGKLPVKMMLPLVLFIFPALFVVILGPAVVQMVEMSNNGELGVFGGG